MKKQYFLFLIYFATGPILAQVGINTTSPKALFEIKSSNEALPTITDGLLIPKVNGFPIANPTIDQQGMLVYLKNISGTDRPGFYYWNFATLDWIPLIAGSGGGTLDQAYDFSGAGLGKTITADAGAVLINGTDGLVSTGTFNSGAIVPAGAGTRMVWNPRKAAFRAGTIVGTLWDDANTGPYSAAFGINNIASGNASAGFGFANNASGQGATAFGVENTASGNYSTAFGFINSATGSVSTVFGEFSTASGTNSTSFGASNNSSGTNATTFGHRNTSKSFSETVFGIGSTEYTLSANGDTQFRTANATDRLFVVGNAIDANDNTIVDVAERSDAFTILKNGLTRLPSTTNAMITAADGKAIVTKEYLQSNTSAWGLTGNAGTNPATNFLGTTDDIDLVLKTNKVDNLRIKNDGRIEIGNKQTNPIYLGATSLSKKIFVATENTTNNIVFQSSNSTGDPVSMYFGGSTGTILTPTISESNQNLSNLFFSGYDGSKFISSSAIHAQLDGVPGLNSMPGRLDFRTSPIGGNNPLIRMVVRSNGNIGIGTETPTQKLHVEGNIRMVDGNQAVGKILTSDAGGTATWQNPSEIAWGLSGNAGTTAGPNFIGTKDDEDIIFKRNNIRAGLLGSSNTSFGINAFNPLSTGINNTATGRAALQNNTAGINNTAIGFEALLANTSGDNNIAIGVLALDTNTTGNDNTAIGRGALTDNVAGLSNTALGRDALFNSTGNNNTAVGRGTLSGVTTGTNNTAIGYDVQVPSATGSNQLRVGNTAVTLASVQVAWTITSDLRWKSNIQKSNLGLDFIKQLNPVFYTRKEVEVKEGKSIISGNTTNPTTEYGFIAQELENTLAKFDTKNNGIISKDDDGMYGVRYNDFIAPIVKALQEQQVIIEIQKTKLEVQDKTITEILERLNTIENKN